MNPHLPKKKESKDRSDLMERIKQQLEFSGIAIVDETISLIALTYALSDETVCLNGQDYKIFIIPIEEDENAAKSQKNG